MSIPKDEMKSFNNFLRKSRIPSSRKMSDRAIVNYEKEHGKITSALLRKNFSQIIADCIRIENMMFDEIMNEIRESWGIDLLGNTERNNSFPVISGLADQAIAALNAKDTVEEKLASVIKILQEVNDGVSFGMKQSGKTRAGAAFQNYLESFFDRLDFRYERQQAIRPGEILDLVFPNLKLLQERHQDAIIMECQTTLKDRFRLSLGKAHEQVGTTKFIATLTGTNIITASDHLDLTDAKINEIRDNHWRLVSLREVSEQKNSPIIISFEDFVNKEYPNRSGLWST